MYWETIQGWFTYQDLYRDMVQKHDKSVFIEIGTYRGKSTVFMAEEIKKSGKDIKFYAIDPLDGTSFDHIRTYENSEEIYYHSIEPVKEFVTTLKGYSFEKLDLFEDDSVDFIFIDASHDYMSVKKDILDWWPKIKRGGIISGHDYDLKLPDIFGIVKAVDEIFPDAIHLIEQDSWMKEKI